MKSDELIKPSHAAKEIGITAGAITYAMDHGLIAFEWHGPYRLIRAAVAAHYKRHRPPAGRPRKNS